MAEIDVFISYSTKNVEAAKAVCHALEENGIRCWIAPRDIPPGMNYGDLIDTAIISSKVFLLVYSSDSLESQWCNGELNVAFTEGKTIVPYRIEPAPLKGAMRVILSQTHWIDSYPDYKSRFSDLVQTIACMVNKQVIIESDGSDSVKKEDVDRLSVKEWIAVTLCAVFGVVGLIVPLILFLLNRRNIKHGKNAQFNPTMIRYMSLGVLISYALMFFIGVIIS